VARARLAARERGAAGADKPVAMMGGEGAAWERRWHGARGAARVRGNKCAGQQNCGEGAGLRDWRGC